MPTLKVSNGAYAPRASSATIYRTIDIDSATPKLRKRSGKRTFAELQPTKDDFNNADLVQKVHPDHTKDLPSLEERKAKRAKVVEQVKGEVARVMERIGKIQYYG